MSLSMDRNTFVRLNREIGDLRQREAAELKKEAEATRKMNNAREQARKASSQSTASMYLNTANRELKNAEAAQSARAKYVDDIARKSQELARIQERISKAEEAEHKASLAASEKRRRDDDRARRALEQANAELRRDYEARVANLEAQIAAQIEREAGSSAPFEILPAEGQTEPYDFFISHASADKEEFVDEFVRRAQSAGLRVWYDRFSIAWGDSIRQKIDEGLRNSYFGVVILSPKFFERPWTNYELDAIIQRDLSGRGRILPIWHRLTQDDIEKYAPTLAGRLALSTASSSSDTIVKELIVVRDRFRGALEGEKPSQ